MQFLFLITTVVQHILSFIYSCLYTTVPVMLPVAHVDMSDIEQDPSSPLWRETRSISGAEHTSETDKISEKVANSSQDDGQTEEAELKLIVIQDFIRTLHIHSKILQETASLPSNVFYDGCKQLDEIIFTTCISSLPEDLRLQLSNSVCDFIVILLEGLLHILYNWVYVCLLT